MMCTIREISMLDGDIMDIWRYYGDIMEFRIYHRRQTSMAG